MSPYKCSSCGFLNEFPDVWHYTNLVELKCRVLEVQKTPHIWRETSFSYICYYASIYVKGELMKLV